MSDPAVGPKAGTVTWVDLTVPDADRVRDFYAAVVGWKPVDVPMGDYNDYAMNPPGTLEAAAGICHARGPNADLPAMWLIYVAVADLDDSLKRCRTLGGTVLAGPKGMGGHGRYAVVRDPAGACLALFEGPRAA